MFHVIPLFKDGFIGFLVDNSVITPLERMRVTCFENIFPPWLENNTDSRKFLVYSEANTNKLYIILPLRMFALCLSTFLSMFRNYTCCLCACTNSEYIIFEFFIKGVKLCIVTWYAL